MIFKIFIAIVCLDLILNIVLIFGKLYIRHMDKKIENIVDDIVREENSKKQKKLP